MLPHRRGGAQPHRPLINPVPVGSAGWPGRRFRATWSRAAIIARCVRYCALVPPSTAPKPHTLCDDVP